MGRIAESMSHQPQRILNTDATNKAEEVDAARQEVGADIVAYGEFTSTVTVWDTDPGQAETKLRHVMQTLANQGFTATAERQHATAAWLSSQPGNRLDNVHRSHQHSLFLAHVSPGVTAAWPGPEYDTHFQAGPWFHVHTEHNTLFRVDQSCARPGPFSHPRRHGGRQKHLRQFPAGAVDAVSQAPRPRCLTWTATRAC